MNGHNKRSWSHHLAGCSDRTGANIMRKTPCQLGKLMDVLPLAPFQEGSSFYEIQQKNIQTLRQCHIFTKSGWWHVAQLNMIYLHDVEQGSPETARASRKDLWLAQRPYAYCRQAVTKCEIHELMVLIYTRRGHALKQSLFWIWSQVS